MQNKRDIVGLVPAAGWARRLPGLPCSKEIYPVGFDTSGADFDGKPRPKAAAQYLLESMQHAGAQRAFIVLREGKWDIPSHLGDGSDLTLPLAYLMMKHPYGVSFTLNQAHPFIRDSWVLTGFPDILFKPLDAYTRLLERLRVTEADVVLGLFPARKPRKMDMVTYRDNGHVTSITIKPDRTSLTYTWIIAAWTPQFTRFLREYVEELLREPSFSCDHQDRDVHLGEALQAAIEVGLHLDSVLFPKGTYIDIGTPEDLMNAVLDHS